MKYERSKFFCFVCIVIINNALCLNYSDTTRHTYQTTNLTSIIRLDLLVLQYNYYSKHVIKFDNGRSQT